MTSVFWQNRDWLHRHIFDALHPLRSNACRRRRWRLSDDKTAVVATTWSRWDLHRVCLLLCHCAGVLKPLRTTSYQPNDCTNTLLHPLLGPLIYWFYFPLFWFPFTSCNYTYTHLLSRIFSKHLEVTWCVCLAPSISVHRRSDQGLVWVSVCMG